MDFLKKHGEKLLLLLLLAGLAISVLLALTTVGTLRNSGDVALSPQQGGAEIQVQDLDQALARITDTPLTVDVGVGAFTPNVRVICINQECRAFIDPNAETCAYCGVTQTVGPRDTDGDGITDSQEGEWNMDPTDPDDVYLDQDNDGFPTLYEVENGTDPTNPQSTPELINFVRLKGVEETSIYFELKGTAKLGDSYTLQLFWRYPGESDGSTAYVRVGRNFGRNNEFHAESFTEKRTQIGDRFVDQSEAVIQSGRYELTLGRTPGTNSGTMTERTATLITIFGPDFEKEARVDETIEVGKKSYNVVDINEDAVVLELDAPDQPDPERITIKSPTREDEEALEKFRPSGGPGDGNEPGTNPDGSDSDGLIDFF